MESSDASFREPWIVRAGRWLTKRRGIILAPLFTVALLAARRAENSWIELGQDLLGFFCLVGGTWFRWVAASYHEGSHRSQPITAGPYAWVRHPLYLANFLLGLGIVLVAGWWPIVLGYLLIFLPIHALIARSEEVHLARLYGREYEVYRRQVPSILPWRRFRGPLYGSRSSFKLKKGNEGLKVLGYAAGMAALLLFKQARQLVKLPAVPHLSIGSGFLAVGMALLAVIVRPRLRWGWLRACQTLIAVGCVLLVAVHLPGIWPMLPPNPPSAEIHSAALVVLAPAQPKTVEFLETAEVPAPVAVHPKKFWANVGSFLWNHLELTGGAAGLGIAALVEGEREERQGRQFEIDEDLGEVGQVALGVAAALSLLKQWQGNAALSRLSQDPQDAWRMQVRPVLDDNHKVAVLATFKRRF